jgi:hypothetical protein
MTIKIPVDVIRLLFVAEGFSRRQTKSRNADILSVIHHRQNILVTTWSAVGPRCLFLNFSLFGFCLFIYAFPFTSFLKHVLRDIYPRYPLDRRLDALQSLMGAVVKG